MSRGKLNVLFRISGGRAIKKELGLGHVYRAINLATRLQDTKIHFLIEDYGGVKELLRKYGYKNIFFLGKNVPINLDIKKTLKLITSKNIDLIIIDKYDPSTNLYAREVNKTTKTVIISDIKKIDFNADLLINGFIGLKNGIIKNKYGTKCLVGPKYQILSKKYENQTRGLKKQFDILATFGGFDEHDIVEIFLNQVQKYLGKIFVEIILGHATKKTKLIKIFEKKYQNNLKIISETKDLKKEISKTRFGICSGGITTYEFANLGVPFGIICQYKHQQKTAREWEKLGVAINLGFPNKKTEIKLRKLLEKIVNKDLKLKSGNALVDGLGAKRVANEILN